jgi:hypothetical protein
MSDNPYLAPAVTDVAAVSGAEEIRTTHLKHEASVKSVGFLYILGGGIGTLAILGVLAPVLMGGSDGMSALGGQELAIFALILVVCIAQLFVGVGLRKLRSWAKIPGAIIAGISLINIPVGTLIGAYILYLLLSKKGATVLSPAYQEIILQTPHIKYRTPMWIWILLLVVVLIIVAAVAFAMFSAKAS